MAPKVSNTTLIIGGLGLAALGVGAYFFFKGEEGGAVPPPPVKYTCPYCGITFTVYSDLLGHIASVHPEEDPDWKEQAAIAAALAQEALEKAQAADAVPTLDEKTDALILAISAYDYVFDNYQQYLTPEAKQDLAAAASLINDVSVEVKAAWTALLDQYKSAASTATAKAESTYAIWDNYNSLIYDITHYTGWVVTLTEKPYFADIRECHRASRLPMGEYPDFNAPSMAQYTVQCCEPVRRNEVSSVSINKYYRLILYDQINFQVQLMDANGPFSDPDVPIHDQAESCKVLPYTAEVEAEQAEVRIEVVAAVSAANVAIEAVHRITGDLRLYNLILSAINSAIALTNSLSARLDALAV